MTRTFVIGRRVFTQLIHDRRYSVISIVGPLIIIYFLKIFMDTLPPTVPLGRYIMAFAAFIVFFLSFLLCTIVLVQERTSGTMERQSARLPPPSLRIRWKHLAARESAQETRC